jgi:hypothetical protein
MTLNIRLLLTWLLWFWAGLLAVVFTPPTASAYAAQSQTAVAYDDGVKFGLAYDAVPVLAAGKAGRETTGGGLSFTKITGFLAAERVATPWGVAVQEASPDALSGLNQVKNGATVYKGGFIDYANPVAGSGQLID